MVRVHLLNAAVVLALEPSWLALVASDCIVYEAWAGHMSPPDDMHLVRMCSW